MTYHSMQACVEDLERHGHLLRITEPVDANLEAAEIHRRVFQRGGPALLFSNVIGCPFPMTSNLFGTMERTRFIFRKTLQSVQRLVELKVDPTHLRKSFMTYGKAALAARFMLPRKCRTGPILAHRTQISKLPQLKSWPGDGGAFITLPLVYSEDPGATGLGRSNLGMYRVQLSGGEYVPDQEIGLHYQIHRGIGVHHTEALRRKEPFRVNIFVGGTPAMTVAAVMPLPEGLSELGFAGALAGHRIPMICHHTSPAIYADADFCITGTVDPERLLPEGPFGDHLGYYSLAHEFPVLRVDAVYHRPGAIWPFTVVGRPPQEDTMFGELIHEITGPVIPTVVHGVRAVHAVDAAGVHPLMLAIGSERYVPYAKLTRPQELLTQAHAILGQGQMSLAKYLLIINHDDAPELKIVHTEAFFSHLLARIDWQRDLHFQTCTTIDTLDYSGSRLNEGSKVVMAAIGPARYELVTSVPANITLPPGFDAPRICAPGILAVRAPALTGGASIGISLQQFCQFFDSNSPINQLRLIVLTEDPDFLCADWKNFLWVTFTRSNPAADIDGVGSFVVDKHWGCYGALVIDARRKPHHAPSLEPDPEVSRRVDAIAAHGGPLAKWI
jgi:4-hydroxy-3-polyprenylbenzoate decarboxylase